MYQYADERFYIQTGDTGNWTPTLCVAIQFTAWSTGVRIIVIVCSRFSTCFGFITTSWLHLIPYSTSANTTLFPSVQTRNVAAMLPRKSLLYQAVFTHLSHLSYHRHLDTLWCLQSSQSTFVFVFCHKAKRSIWWHPYWNGKINKLR